MQFFQTKTKTVPTFVSIYEQYNETKLFNVSDYYSIFMTQNVPYINLNGKISSTRVLFIRNIHLSNNTIPSFKPDVEIQKDYFLTLSNFRIFSYPNKPQVLFGKWLDETKNVNLIDVTNQRVNDNLTFFNFDYIIEFQNCVSDIDWFIYIEQLNIISKFRPKYEFILYPFTGNRLLPQIYNSFEIENNEIFNYLVPPECKDNIYNNSWDLSINRPKLLFSQDKLSWKIWDFDNNQWVTITQSNPNYVTQSEILSQGMTYTDYLNIPDSAFDLQDDWYVMINNYIPGFTLKSKYLDDFVGATNVVKIDSPDSFEDRITIFTI